MDGKIREIEEYYKDADVTWHDAMDVANRALDDIPYLLTRIKELEEGIKRWINSDWEGDDDVTYFKKLIEKEKPCQP